MDDLSEKLASVLNDPESMQKVRAVAESILGDNKKEEQSKDVSDLSGILGAGELKGLVSIISRFNEGGNDARSQLLRALKPHLSEPRREKVETAIKILKMIELLPLLKESGFLNL